VGQSAVSDIPCEWKSNTGAIFGKTPRNCLVHFF
jgi:hypothetical protein